MFHPVGSQPPSVYWRRRLAVIASVIALIVLVALTANALGGDDGTASANGTSSSTAPPTSHTPVPASTAKPSSSARSTGKHSPSTQSGSSGSTAPPVAQCTAKSLAIAAAVGAPTYKVGQHPLLQLQVTNVGAQPCVQDLADKQVELRVYNGESRVWGSHDCRVQPGTTDRTLAPKVAVKVTLDWSGLSSQKGCKGTRQRVGAGSYTLYTLLAGRMGKAAQFSIS